MRPWVYALSGLLIWGLHFAGAYAIASLDALTPKDDEGVWRAGSLGFSAACALGWLADVLARIATHPAHRIDELLSWNWKALGQEALTAAAA